MLKWSQIWTFVKAEEIYSRISLVSSLDLFTVPVVVAATDLLPA